MIRGATMLAPQFLKNPPNLGRICKKFSKIFLKTLRNSGENLCSLKNPIFLFAYYLKIVQTSKMIMNAIVL